MFTVAGLFPLKHVMLLMPCHMLHALLVLNVLQLCFYIVVLNVTVLCVEHNLKNNFQFYY